LSKLTIEIPTGELCWSWSSDDYCKLYDSNWNRCKAFGEEIFAKYNDKDETIMDGYKKCSECINSSFE